MVLRGGGGASFGQVLRVILCHEEGERDTDAARNRLELGEKRRKAATRGTAKERGSEDYPLRTILRLAYALNLGQSDETISKNCVDIHKLPMHSQLEICKAETYDPIAEADDREQIKRHYTKPIHGREEVRPSSDTRRRVCCLHDG